MRKLRGSHRYVLGLLLALGFVFLALPSMVLAALFPTDTIGLFRPGEPAGNNTFFLRNANTLGAPSNTIAGFGIAPGDVPIVGDWNGDGITTIGVFRPNNTTGSNDLYLLNINQLASTPKIAGFGLVGDMPIVGDWDGNGTSTLGVLRPNVPAGSNTILLWNSLTPGAPDVTISGVGAVLMQACLKAVREAGGGTAWLGVWEHNGRARAFYSKWGFREVGTHAFCLGTDIQTDVLMEKVL